MENNFGGNITFKETFLDNVAKNYSTSTQNNIHNLLRSAKFYEDLYGKDLYDFTLSEMIDMLKSQRVKTKNSLRQRASMYSMYIQFAVDEGIGFTNVIRQITAVDYDTMVDLEATSQRYIERKELFTNLTYLINAQDQVIFALLFDGVMGKNYENLINLKLKDINKETLEAKLFDGTVVNLSKDTYNLIQLADSEDTYDSYSDKTFKITRNEYVVRACKRRIGEEHTPLKPSAIRSKIDQFKKNLDINGLTGRSIYLSGVAERYVNSTDSRRRIDISNWLLENNVSTNATEMADIIDVIENKAL